MIELNEIKNKIQDILNNSPLEFSFIGATQGYHLDTIADEKDGKNKIPFFVSLEGGVYNPIPDLKESRYNIQVVIYYPIRFKDSFYLLNEYLENTFVGKIINYGTLTGSGLNNISVARYGEIIGLDINQFAKWAEETYHDPSIFQKTEDHMSPWMSMGFNIYISKLATGITYGNDVSYKLKISLPEATPKKIIIVNYLSSGTTYTLYTRDPSEDIIIPGRRTFYAWKSNNGTYRYTLIENLSGGEDIYLSADTKDTTGNVDYIKEYEFNNEETFIENLVWSNSGTGGSITPLSQQIIGKDPFVKNMANITQFNKSFVVYPDLSGSKELWNRFIHLYNIQRMDMINEIRFIKSYNTSSGIKNFVLPQIILSINENVDLGQPLSFTFTLGDKK